MRMHSPIFEKRPKQPATRAGEIDPDAGSICSPMPANRHSFPLPGIWPSFWPFLTKFKSEVAFRA